MVSGLQRASKNYISSTFGSWMVGMYDLKLSRRKIFRSKSIQNTCISDQFIVRLKRFFHLIDGKMYELGFLAKKSCKEMMFVSPNAKQVQNPRKKVFGRSFYLDEKWSHFDIFLFENHELRRKNGKIKIFNAILLKFGQYLAKMGQMREFTLKTPIFSISACCKT